MCIMIVDGGGHLLQAVDLDVVGLQRECFPRIEQMVAFDVVIFMGYTSLMWLRTKV